MTNWSYFFSVIGYIFSPEFGFESGFGFGRADNRSLFQLFSGNKLRRKEPFLLLDPNNPRCRLFEMVQHQIRAR